MSQLSKLKTGKKAPSSKRKSGGAMGGLLSRSDLKLIQQSGDRYASNPEERRELLLLCLDVARQSKFERNRLVAVRTFGYLDSLNFKALEAQKPVPAGMNLKQVNIYAELERVGAALDEAESDQAALFGNSEREPVDSTSAPSKAS